MSNVDKGEGKPVTSIEKDEESEEQNNSIYDFFKKMSTGELSNDMDPNIPFKLNVSTFRRRKIMDAIMGPS